MIDIVMRIKEVCRGRNLTQAALDRKNSQNRTVISSYEMGIRMPMVAPLCELALFLQF